MPSDKEIDDIIKKLESMKTGKKEKSLKERWRDHCRARTEDRNRGFSKEEEEAWRNMSRKPLTDKDLDRIFKKEEDK